MAVDSQYKTLPFSDCDGLVEIGPSKSKGVYKKLNSTASMTQKFMKLNSFNGKMLGNGFNVVKLDAQQSIKNIESWNGILSKAGWVVGKFLAKKHIKT